ncbi:hypothetical protein [Lysobacter brunescens]|uniref:Lipoprotein n=1 Tax=Lysobacter brunescens TaxID=262323 RepID=A0ABW2Y9E1_9GAMM
MQYPKSLFVLVALVACTLGACNERSAPPSATEAPDATTVPADPAAVPAAYPTDRWVGQWGGPEGTSLVIGGRDGVYDLVITNLDGPRRFPGRADGTRIVFNRDGVEESMRQTNGLDTGMKWLSEKTQCLTIRTGEGFCRD